MTAVDLAAVAADDRTIEALRAGETPSDEHLVRLLAAMQAWVREGES
jgi:hypothetical protein